jgi:hypothetical protein
MSHLILLASRHLRFVPRTTPKWTLTKIHALDRILRKRGIVRVTARRNALETENAIEKGNESVTETETEIGSLGEMAQEVEVDRAAEIEGSIIHTREQIGRWQKEWDFELFFFSLHLGRDAGLI